MGKLLFKSNSLLITITYNKNIFLYLHITLKISNCNNITYYITFENNSAIL